MSRDQGRAPGAQSRLRSLGKCLLSRREVSVNANLVQPNPALCLHTSAVVKTFALALALTMALTSPSYAVAPLCGDLFRTPPTGVKAFVQDVLKPRVLGSLDLAKDAASAFRYAPLKERLIWTTVAARFNPELSNPFKMGFDLNEAAERVHSSAEQELRSLFTILAKHRLESRINGLDRWVKSETHALVLHKILSLRGLGLFERELQALHERNVFVADGFLVDGSFLTFSFEKEGRGKEIGLLYRPAKTSEADWFKESDEERFQTLFDRFLPQKFSSPALLLAPTSLKPSYLGGFSFDGRGSKRSWEVAHKGYEISLHRTLQEIRDISKLVCETHSFHVHAVFEMPKSDPSFDRFLRWFKNLNDALYLKGMEEGLHGENLTGLVNFKSDVSKADQVRTLDVRKPEDVTLRNQKFFSAGLRGQMYGPASSSKRVKLGIELRDSTRKLETLEDSMTRLSDSLSKKVWERLPSDDSTDFARLFENGEKTVEMLVKAGLRVETARTLLKAETTVALPLLPLEEKPVFNFKTAQYENASADYVLRLQTSRASFTKALFSLQEELDGFKSRGEAVESQDIQMAIRQTLTEWARQARPSERFSF